MSNLVGTGLNQVPTNGMLGGLAYQDPNHASIKDLDLKNLSQINSEIADTAVDVFVYDTRKDSDGGAWRKRTQNTSWYNETLGTATRGSRKEFPAVAVIVMQEGTLTIYDGDDPDLPMWMVFTDNNDNGSQFASAKMLSCRTATSIFMLNGMLMCGGKGAYHDGATELNFLSDSAKKHMNNGYYYSTLNISQRETTGGYYTVTSGTPSTVSNLINDVAMTVLPNAPIDSATGLPIPTIAVATAAGTSVIKDDGTVVDFNDSLGSTRPVATVAIRGNDIVHWNVNNGTLQQFFDALTATADSEQEVQYNYTASGGHGTCENITALLRDSGDGPYHIATRDSKSIAAGAQSGMSVFVDGIDRNIVADSQSIFDSRVAYITSDYNTGWMHGDIKGAFLSGISTTNAVGGNLIVDSSANDAGDFNVQSDVDSWTASAATLSLSSGKMRITTASGQTGYAYKSFTTVVGKQYVFSANLTYNSGTRNVRLSGVSPTGTDIVDLGWGSSSADFYHVFTATSTTTYVALGTFGGYSDVDNVVVTISEQDRSVNNNGLQVLGTITKSPVATGADLVAYSGFSNSDYLIQPPNSDMQTGTGDFSVMCWFKTTSTANVYEGLLFYNSPESTVGGFQLMLGPTNTNKGLYWYVYGTGGAGTASSGYVTGFNDGNWHCAVTTHTSSQIQLYVDGVLRQTASHNIGTINNTNARFTVGRWYGDANSSLYWWRGSLALVRHSTSIPSAEQIKKIYEDEKVLFQENAKATLYGSSDAVTALAYDDATNLLHVGTSAGRSEFQGLRRINNTTTAVTTAISASNDLVAEQ